MNKVSLEQAPTRAFSLVEVAIALGIISFVLLAVAGMMGVGLDASKSAQIDTIQAASARSLLSKMATNEFGNFAPSTIYLKSDGTTNSSSDGTVVKVVMSTITANAGLRPEATNDFRLVKIEFISPAMANTNNQITNTVYASITR